MGQKVNLYLDDETLKLWKRIPSGQRSPLIKAAIRDHAKDGDIDERQERMMHLKQHLASIDNQQDKLSDERAMYLTELDRLTLDVNPMQIDKAEFWTVLEAKAVVYHEQNSIYHSTTGKSRYRIHDAGAGKIHIHNLRTDRTTSNFSKHTVDRAIDRLIAGGGTVAVGQFIPVKMHEYTVVALHPRLMVEDGHVIYLEQEMVPVTEEMIPQNETSPAWHEPPTDWTSNEGWLAVRVDGKRGHVCISTPPSWPGSDKITFHFIDEHPNLPGDLGDGLWMTKYYRFPDPGTLYWGHAGATQKILTPMIN